MKKQILNNLKAIIIGLIIVLGINIVVAATFTGPTCAPPGCNTDAPLNVGSSIQAKSGRLSLGPAALLITNVEAGINLALKVDGTILSNGATFNGPIAINYLAGAGKVLVSKDSSGFAEWQDPSILGGVKMYNMVLDNVTSKSITFWNPYKAFGPGLQTLQLNLAIDPDSGPGAAALKADSETRNRLCSTLFPDAPNNVSFTQSTFTSPSDNSTIYWDSANNRFALVISSTAGMNSIVQWGTQFTCSSAQVTNVI